MVPIVNIHSHRKPKQGEWVIRNAWLPKQADWPLQTGYFYSVGIHPWFANRFSDDSIRERLTHLLTQENVKAIGEIGLDRTNGPDFSIQEHVFKIQVEIARQHNKPIIIHAVRAYSDLAAYIKKYELPFILHHYQGNLQATQQLLRFPNVYFSFGKLLFQNENVAAEKLKQIPLDRLFLESDTLPIPIQRVYEKAGRLLLMDVETLYQTTFNNFSKIIKI